MDDCASWRVSTGSRSMSAARTAVTCHSCVRSWEWSAAVDMRKEMKDFWVCPPRESRHPVTVMSMSNGHAQSFWKWHACSAANEFAEDDASTSLQLATVTQSLPPLNLTFVDTSPINSPNSTHGDMKMNERHLPWHLYGRWWCPAIYPCSTTWKSKRECFPIVRRCRTRYLLPLAIVKSPTPSPASVTVGAGLL